MLINKYMPFVSTFFLGFFLVALLFLSNPLVTYANYSFPSWWSDQCDTSNYFAHSGLTPVLFTTWLGIQACGYGPVQNSSWPDIDEYMPGSSIPEKEWECTELVKRYLYLAFGVTALYNTNGDQIVNNYANAYSNVFSSIDNTNGNPNHFWPKVGDVISYSDIHTAIIMGVNITDSVNGNATLTLLEQNASTTGTTTQQFTGWKIKGDIDDPNDNGADTVTGWLTPSYSIKTYGTTSSESFYSLIPTSDGGLVVSGKTGSSFLLTKFGADGNVVWQKSYGIPGASIAATSDGGFILAGTGGGYYGYLGKLDSSGNVAWFKTFSNFYLNLGNFNSVASTSDGGFIVVGNSRVPYNSFDALVIKFDSSGNISWQKTYGGTNYDDTTSVLPVSDGYIVSGRTSSTSTGYEGAWLFKINTSGSLVWTKTYNSSNLASGGVALAVASTSDGNYIAVGGFGSDGTWVFKFDGSGTQVWQKIYSGNGAGSAIAQTSDGGYVIGGTTYSWGAGARDAWLVKIDGSGNLIWQKAFGGTGYDAISGVLSKSYGIFASGFTSSFGAGNYDAWLLKIDANGTIGGAICTAEYSSSSSASNLSASGTPRISTNSPSISGSSSTLTSSTASLSSSDICRI